MKQLSTAEKALNKLLEQHRRYLHNLDRADRMSLSKTDLFIKFRQAKAEYLTLLSTEITDAALS